MKKILTGAVLVVSGAIIFAPGAAAQNEAPGPPAGYGSEVGVVKLKGASGKQMEKVLRDVGRRWGLFPGLEIAPLEVEGADAGALLFRGREQDLELAQQLSRALEGLFPEEAAEILLNPVPLNYLRAPRMKELLLELAGRAKIPLFPEQVVVFPPGDRGGLFLLAPAAFAGRLKVLAEALDRPEYSSPADLLWRFLREFLSDLGNHFLTVSTYLVSALILVAVHFLITIIPGVGPRYQRWFTLIWTRLLDGVKGRDFAYEILKSLAAAAVASVRRPLPGTAGSPGSAREKAVSAGRDLLRYRGFNPDDPATAAVFSHLLDAELAKKTEQ